LLYNGDRACSSHGRSELRVDHYVYLLFTVDPDSATTDVTKPAYGRLERYTVVLRTATSSISRRAWY